MQFKRGQTEVPNLFSIHRSHSKACVPSDLWEESQRIVVLGYFLLLYLQYTFGHELLQQVLRKVCFFGMVGWSKEVGRKKGVNFRDLFFLISSSIYTITLIVKKAIKIQRHNAGI